MSNCSRLAKSIAAIATAMLILAGMATNLHATTVHITFFKARHAVEGFGNLFFEGERYRIEIEGIAVGSLKPSRSDLAGSVENMHAASDILGTYKAAEPDGSTVVDNGKPVRVKNGNGVILDLSGMNSGRLSLDLAGMTITSRGWGPDAKERTRR